jgi:hypothetical protein
MDKKIEEMDTAELGLMYGQQVDVLHQAQRNITALQAELTKRKENGEDEQDNPITE